MRGCTGRGAVGGAPRGHGAACGRGCPAKRLDGSGDGEALHGPLVRGLLPRVVHPPKWIPILDGLQFAPQALQFHPPFFLPVEEAEFPMGPPHQGTARDRKNLRQVPGTNWFGDGGQVFSRLGLPCPCLPCAPPAPPPPPLFRIQCRKRRRNAQRSVTYATSADVKRGASVEYPLSNTACTQGRVS